MQSNVIQYCIIGWLTKIYGFSSITGWNEGILDSGEILSMFLHNHAESNYVEQHLLTFWPLIISAFGDLKCELLIF